MPMKKYVRSIVVTFLIITSCTTETKNEYPVEITQNFMNSCMNSGGSQEACACMLNEVEKEYTIQEFSIIETKLHAGQTPSDFLEFTGKAKLKCSGIK
jgi:hypothetical protein